MEILEALKEHIAVKIMKKSDGFTLGDDEPLIDQGIVDSLGILSLLTFLEQKFSVKITDDELTPENFATPAAMARMIRDKLMGQKEA
jgi:acyl carrier protein